MQIFFIFYIHKLLTGYLAFLAYGLKHGWASGTPSANPGGRENSQTIPGFRPEHPPFVAIYYICILVNR